MTPIKRPYAPRLMPNARARRPPVACQTAFKAVCFDLDGVLIDTMPLHAQAWQAALAPFGRSVSRRQIYQWEGEPGRVTARALFAGQGHRASPAMVTRLLADKERRFSRLARHICVDRRFQALLDELSGSGIRLALVTGTSRAEVERVVSARILRRFACVVTGDRVRHGKPHSEPYRTACRRLRVIPALTLVVENAPYGIRSARGAGVGLVIALASSLPARFLREAHMTARSVDQLARLIRRLVDSPLGQP